MKNHFVAASGEFLFLYFGFAAHRMAVEQTVVYIALEHGFSLLVTVWAFYWISGG